MAGGFWDPSMLNDPKKNPFAANLGGSPFTTMQQDGLKQNQPTIKPPQTGPELQATYGNNPETFNQLATINNWQQPNQDAPTSSIKENPSPVNQPSNNPPSPNSPGANMNFLDSVRSREQRAMDRGMADATAMLRKRGLNTSAIGQTLENTARADLGQRMNENITAAAYEDYKLNRQIELERDKFNRQLAHETELQNIIGQQKASQTKLETDEQLRGARGMIPINTEEYTAGINAYNTMFPNGNPNNPQFSANNPGGGNSTPSFYELQAASEANRLMNEEQKQARAGGNNSFVPNVGPGSSPSNALSAGGSSSDPNFGYTSGPIGPGGSRNTPRSPNFNPASNPGSNGTGVSSAGNGGVSSATGQPANQPNWFPNLQNPNFMTPINQMPPQNQPAPGPVTAYSGGPRPGNGYGPLQATTSRLGV